MTTHDHYQGGRYEFAMSKAEDIYKFEIKGYEDIKISIVKWPLSVVRISGEDRHKLSELAEKILNHWRNYSNEEIKGYEDIKISIVKWPLSVVRISGEDRHKLSELAEKILNHWRNYSNEEVGVYAYSGDTPHNTITPIVRKRNVEKEMINMS